MTTKRSRRLKPYFNANAGMSGYHRRCSLRVNSCRRVAFSHDRHPRRMKGIAMTRQRSDRAQDKNLEDTFPASDPPANSGVTGAEPPASSQQKDGDKPTGRPTSDRHATETAHHSEQEQTTTDEAKR
jgi:hypothetical protein